MKFNHEVYNKLYHPENVDTPNGDSHIRKPPKQDEAQNKPDTGETPDTDETPDVDDTDMEQSNDESEENADE